MYNFKEFFIKNFDYTILLEASAYRGTYSKTPILIDEEDLDFLYQIDQKFWGVALQQRIQKTWNLLKIRQDIRNKISTEILNTIKNKFGGAQKAYERKLQGQKRKIFLDESNINEFKDMVLGLAGSYDNYGERSSSTTTREDLSTWFDKLLTSYDLTKSSRKGNFRLIRTLIHEIIKHIVIYVKGGDQEEYTVGKCPNCKKIKFFINRYIEKFETLPGDEHTIKAKLENLSQVYGKDIEFETHGKYGIDLSNARKVKETNRKDRAPEIIYRAGAGDQGFNFPKEAIQALKNLYSLNYHRHYGALPSDLGHEADVTYKIVRSGATEGSEKPVYDKEIQNTLQNNLYNLIKRFVDNNKNLNPGAGWTAPQINDLLEGSPFPEVERKEMENGIWLVKYINPNITSTEEVSKINEDEFKKIFHDNYAKIEDLKDGGKIGVRALSWMTSWENIAGNVKLKDIFANYFSEKRTKEIISQQTVHGPKILSVDMTGNPSVDDEIRKKEIEKISEKDREELKKVLGEKDWESFMKTGRLPYKINGDEIRVGSGEWQDTNNKKIKGDSPKIILPYIKIGEGDKERQVPLLNVPSFVRSSVHSLTSAERKTMGGKKNRIIKELNKLGFKTDSIDFDSIADLQKLFDNPELPEKIKKSIDDLLKIIKEEEGSITTTSRSGVFIGKDGKEVILNKFFRTPDYTHGAIGTRLTGFRSQTSRHEPGVEVSERSKIGFAKIFPIGSEVKGSEGLLIGSETWKYFEDNPDKMPEDPSTMKYLPYVITKDTSFSENNNNYKFMLIKEADEESDDFFRDEEDDDSKYRAADGGSLKKTSFSDKIRAKSYFQIRQASNASEASVYGWNDIVEGMRATLLKRNFGANDAQQEDIIKAIEKDFESIHDKIVDHFFKNSASEKLHSPSGRRDAASSEVAKSSGAGKLQRGNAETESQNRKLRTSKNSMPVRDLVAGDNEVDPKTIEPLTYYPPDSPNKEKREQFLLVFFDTSKQKKFEHPTNKDSYGKPMMFMPDLTFNKGEHPRPYVFREDLRSYLDNNSNVIRFILENKDKVNNSNYSLLVDILDKEKTNLLSYWKDIFPKITPKYEEALKRGYGKEGEIKRYTGDKYTSIYSKIEEVYNTQKEELNDIIKTNVQKIPEIPVDAQIEAGYNQLLAIVKEIEDIIKDENYGGKTLFHKEIKKEPIIVNWHKSIGGLYQTLVYPGSEDAVTKEKLIQVILRHIGGWSASSQRLKYPAELFLKKLSDNFNEFVKLLKAAPPNGNTAASSTLRNKQDNIIKGIPAALSGMRSEFIKQAKMMNPEIK